MSKKKLLINQVKVASLQDRATLPTRIQYSGKSFRIGHETSQDDSGNGRVIGNFKVELGRQTKEQLRTQKQSVSKGHSRSFMGVAKDFLEALCDEVSKDISRFGQNLPKKVLVAEPISIEEEGKVSGQWLANYRFAVKSALQSRFDEVDFLPEPFAVFQYYRYGLRHPLLHEQARHIALVLDFGGGTFDVSVIETTKGGDISQSGKASRPLAAKSIPVGGFFINQKIAESVLFSVLPDKKSKTASRTTLKSFGDFSSQSIIDLESLPTEQSNFARHFQRLLDDVELAKINICGAIKNWELTQSEINPVRQIIRVPRSPFSESGGIVEVSLSAECVKEIFVRDVWDARLKEAITKAVARAKEEIQGKSISVVLLSGGSTNIGWTKTLIERDLSSILADASILEISENYQEVVAKGLAVECARQFYTEGDGDFGAVTYNRLNLVVRSDDGHPDVLAYKPRTHGLPQPEAIGTLLPSAASLRVFQGKPISWKTRLPSAPSHSLGYYYLKASFDPEDLENLNNVVANRVFIKNRVFGQSIDVELQVEADGTAYPSFLFNRGKAEKEERVSGEPFYLDMTYAGDNAAHDSYLGLDFGTATSAASIVFKSDIIAYDDRSKNKSWLELSDLIEVLPYPVAHPLAQYVSQTDRRLLETSWKTAIEAMLTLAAYLSFADVCATHGKRVFDFPDNFNRSAGPLLNLMSNLQRFDLTKTSYAKTLLRLADADATPNTKDILAAINAIKHDRVTSIDFNQSLTRIGNIIKDALAGSQFGTFESSARRSFGSGYIGSFRSFRGPNAPFISLYNYAGSSDFSGVDVFVANLKLGTVLSLSPLYYSFANQSFDLRGDCPLYFLDSVRGAFEDYRFISVKRGEGLNINSHVGLRDVGAIAFEHLKGLNNFQSIDGLEFSDR